MLFLHGLSFRLYAVSISFKYLNLIYMSVLLVCCNKSTLCSVIQLVIHADFNLFIMLIT